MNRYRRGALLCSDARTNTSLYAVEDSHTLLKVSETKDVERVSAVLKSAVRQARGRSSLPGLVKAVFVRRIWRNGFSVERLIDRSGQESDRELLREEKDGIEGQEERMLGQLIYQNLATICPKEVLMSRIGPLGRAVAAKVHHCCFRDSDRCMEEVMMLAKAQSHESSKLIDVTLRVGTRNLFELEIAIEGLELSLDADLKQRIQTSQSYTQTELLRILSDLSAALLFAKFQVSPRQGIVHRDIKPKHIYMHKGHYKLAWCGSACSAYDPEIVGDGTPCYLSPEMRRLLLGERIEIDLFPNDIFTLGMAMLHLTQLALPSTISSASRNSAELKQAVASELSGLHYSAAYLDLLGKMLKMEPNERPRIEEIRLFATSMLSESPSSLHELPANVPISPSVLIAQTKAYLSQSQFQEAETALLKHLLTEGISAHLIPAERHAFALLYLKQGKYSQSRRILEETVSHDREQLSEESLERNLTLGEAYMKEGMLKQAESVLNQCLKSQIDLYQETNPDIVQTYALMGELYRLKRLNSEAKAMLLHSLELSNRLLPHPNDSTVLALASLGRLYEDMGQFAEAERSFRQSHSIVREVCGDMHPHMAAAFVHLSGCFLTQNRYREAEILIKRAICIASTALGDSHPDTTAYSYRLALLYTKEQRLNEAEMLYLHCIKAQISEFGEDNRSTLEYSTELALNYLAKGESKPAKAILIRVVQTFKRSIGEASHIGKVATYHLACIWAAEGKWSRAESLFFTLWTIWVAQYGEIRVETADICAQLARMYEQMGDVAAATQLSRRSQAILSKLPQQP